MLYFFAALVALFCQDSKPIPGELLPFVLDGYEVLDYSEGDLNQDKLNDALLILKKPNEKDLSDVVEHPEPRPLLILIRQKDGSFQMASRNDKVVLCVDCGGVFGDPYAGMTIKNGYFSIEHYGGSNWRWERIITFKYSVKDKRWFLHKDGTVRYQPSNEVGGEDIRTKKDFGSVEFGQFDVYKEQ